MDIFLVFNELSIRPNPDDTIYTARELMERFTTVIKHCRANKVKPLKAKENFQEMPLARDYTVADWLQDRSVDRDRQRLLRSSITALHPLPEPNEEKRQAMEFQYNGKIAEGLGGAWLLDSLAVSLATGPEWEALELPLETLELDDESDQLIGRKENVKHLFSAEQFPLHQAWLQNRIRLSVRNGQMLLEKSTEWFFKLEFVATAQTQIKQLSQGDQLAQLIKRLLELHDYCTQWTEGGFDADALLKCTTESQTVRNTPELRQHRIFSLPDGRERYFEWHIRLTPNEWRLHFWPDPETRLIYIGYVGKHLPTGKYK